MGPVQGHQCPYDAPSVAEHFRKTGTVNLNPADVLLFRDSLGLGMIHEPDGSPTTWASQSQNRRSTVSFAGRAW